MLLLRLPDTILALQVLDTFMRSLLHRVKVVQILSLHYYYFALLARNYPRALLARNYPRACFLLCYGRQVTWQYLMQWSILLIRVRNFPTGITYDGIGRRFSTSL